MSMSVNQRLADRSARSNEGGSRSPTANQADTQATDGGTEAEPRPGVTTEAFNDPFFDLRSEVEPKGGRTRTAAGFANPNPSTLLAELALSRVLGPAGLRRLRSGPNELVLLTVPDLRWVAPVESMIHRDVRNVSVVRVQGERQRERANIINDATVGLGQGRLVVVITTSLDAVPVALRSAADNRVMLRGADPVMVAKAIRIFTRRRLKTALTDADLAGLTLDDLVAAMRPNSTPDEIVRRLRRAAARIAEGADLKDAPDLATLAGYGAAKDWAMGLVADVARFRAGELDGNELESAILAGPPGTGKTQFSRALARAAQLPLVETSIGDWMSGSPYLDSVLGKQNAFFDAVLAQAPCIGFIDECDALPGREKVTSRNADFWNVVSTNQLLRCAEVRSAGRGAVLLAATNHLDRIDPALRRPGRFDRIFTIALPDATALATILRGHLGDDLAGMDLSGVARLGQGGTGADALGWIRAARQIARRAGRSLSLIDLVGVIQPEDTRPTEFVRAVALHEAGHAIAAVRLGLTVERVSIEPRGDAAGWTELSPTLAVPTRAWIEAVVIELLGGRAADIVLGTGPHAGASVDLRMATAQLTALHTSHGLGDGLLYRRDPGHAADLLAGDPVLAHRLEQHLQRLMAASLRLIEGNRRAVSAVAEALVRQRVLTGSEVVNLAANHPETCPRPSAAARQDSVGSVPLA